MTVRLPHQQWEDLRSFAKAQGKPVAELIRTYIEWGLENEPR